MKRHWLVIWFAVAGLLLALNAFADKTALEKEYQQRYGQTERMARDSNARRDLAKELLNVARNVASQERAVFYCRKAYDVGSKNISGYLTASEALDLMQRTDPETRLEALEKLEYLYASFYRARSKILPAGTAQAEVLRQIAEERLSILDAKINSGRIAPTEAYELISKAVRNMSQASATLGKVMHRARKDSLRSKQHAPAASESLAAYAEKLKSIQDDLNEQRKTVDVQRKTWGNLQLAYRRFKAQSNALNAQALMKAYLFDLDRPEILPVAVHRKLTDDSQQMITLSCKAPADLKNEQLMQLANWYNENANTLGPETRRLALLRALVYVRQAQRKKVSEAKALQERIAKLLQSDMDENSMRTAAHELEARLEYEFGSRPAVVADSTPPDSIPPRPKPSQQNNTNTNTPSNNIDTSTGTTDTAPQSDTPSTSNTGTLISLPDKDGEAPVTIATTNRSGGRKMLQCNGCGRQFFPGYGDESHTHCPRCKSGAKNIFDMEANSQMD